MIVMNFILQYCNLRYRPPARIKTLMQAARIDQSCCDGVRIYVVCNTLFGGNTGMNGNNFGGVY